MNTTLNNINESIVIIQIKAQASNLNKQKIHEVNAKIAARNHEAKATNISFISVPHDMGWCPIEFPGRMNQSTSRIAKSFCDSLPFETPSSIFDGQHLCYLSLPELIE